MLHGIFSAQGTKVVPPPVGRVFNVGTGSGSLTVDAEDSGKEWFPLQPNDVFKIAAGSYTNINLLNFHTDTHRVYVNTDGGTVTATQYISIRSDLNPQKNVSYSFGGGIKGTYGLKLQASTSQTTERLYFDTNLIGGTENVVIEGIDTIDVNDRGWRFYGQAVEYNNGSGIPQLINVTVDNCRWISSISQGGSGIDFGNEFEYHEPESGFNKDRGYIEGLNLTRLVLKGGNGNGIHCGNVNNLFVDDILIEDVNPDITGNPNFHARILDLKGQGIIQRVKGIGEYGNYGNLVRLVCYNRVGKTNKSIIRNCIGYNTRKYSVIEVNYESNNYCIQPDVTEWTPIFVLGNTAVEVNTNVDVESPSLSIPSTVMAIYNGDAVGHVTARNNVAANTNGSVSAVNDSGAINTGSNNVYYATKEEAGITDVVDFIPSYGSPLNGAGVANADLLLDYFNIERPNPPTIGAVEAGDEPPEPPEPKVIAINMYNSGSDSAPGNWNNLLHNNTGITLKYMDGTDTSIEVDNSNWGDASGGEGLSNTNPIPEVFDSDWWSDESVRTFTITGLDAGKSYKFKMLGYTAPNAPQYSLSNTGTPNVVQSGYPSSGDLFDTTGYAVLEATAETSVTIYAFRVSDWYGIMALIIEEHSD